MLFPATVPERTTLVAQESPAAEPVPCEVPEPEPGSFVGDG